MIQQVDFYKNKDLNDITYFNENLREWFTEQWKDIPEYEGYYQASDFGRIKSLKRIIICKDGRPFPHKEKILSQTLDTDGYPRVYLCKNNKRHSKIISRLIGKTFIPNPENLPEINHIGLYPDGREGNKLDNRVISLQWSNRLNNVRHAHKNGLMTIQKGEEASRAKLLEIQVLEIKKLFCLGSHNKTQLAYMFNVSPTTISAIIVGKSWKHI